MKLLIGIGIGLFIGAGMPCAAYAEGSPQEEGDSASPSDAKTPGAGAPVKALKPTKAMLRAADVGKRARPVAARKAALDNAAAGVAAPAAKASKKPKGQTPLEAKAALADENSPWNKVNVPDEMAVGIEFKKPGRGTRFAFNLVDADLIELIKIIGNITGRAFILGGKVPHLKATIYAPTKITAAEAYQAFLSVLQVNGLTVVPAGKYLKIVSIGGPTSQNMRIVGQGNAPQGDEIVTRLHPLEHVSADELVDVLSRFKSADGDITVYAPTNTLIITDYGASIRRLLKLIDVLDAPGTGEQIWIEPVNHADAKELADRIMEIFDVAAPTKKSSSRSTSTSSGRSRKSSRTAPPGPSVVGEEDAETKISKILADERTNSLIIVASENAYLRILELVKRLDLPIAGEGTLHVHKLQHADAEELSKTLNNLSKGSSRTSSKKSSSASDPSASLFEGEVQISADKATNSLVIVSTIRDYLSLKKVIEDLDVMQRQVFVEAVILEVSLDKNRDLGVGFHVGNEIGSGDETSLLWGTSTPTSDMSSLAAIPGMMSGLAAGLRGPEIPGIKESIGLSIPAFGVALQALQTNSDVNVLSTPHILATDNVEASITVGENVPVQAGYNPMGSLMSQLGGLGGAASSSTTSAAAGLLGGMGGMGGYGGFSISRQNVGLTLNITPQINDDNQVRLEIKLEVSEVSSVDSTMGPNISKKNANTTSIVADQQTIVIGGLITDNEVETTQKVPVLGDIPILGFFFRHKSSLIKKRNLLIFLTPYIIRSSEDFRDIFTRKMAERREFIERWTAFEYHRVDPHLDWSRTNGVVSEINEVVRRAQEEEQLRLDSEATNMVDHTPKTPVIFPRGGAKWNSGETDGASTDEGDGDQGGNP